MDQMFIIIHIYDISYINILNIGDIWFFFCNE